VEDSHVRSERATSALGKPFKCSHMCMSMWVDHGYKCCNFENPNLEHQQVDKQRHCDLISQWALAADLRTLCRPKSDSIKEYMLLDGPS
jgi:hypothetical protein